MSLLALTDAVDRASLGAAVLALCADAVALGGIVLVLPPGRRTRIARLSDWVGTDVGRLALLVAAAVAVLATMGSLWFSEIGHLEPCRLCWFQRTAMYPLSVVLVVAAWRSDRRVLTYALPLALLGACVSIYHSTLEWFPSLDSGSCDALNPCTVIWFRRFGFASLPFMALSGFAAIAGCVVVAALAQPPASTPVDPAGAGEAGRKQCSR